MEKPLFSIIVPVYKVERYLEKCIKTLIEQTEKNIEIILVDDGSPDNCPFICDKYEKEDNRIMVVHKKNGGLSDARNSGILKASGEYVMFVDSDDYIDLNGCERLIPYTKLDADIIVSDGISEGGKVNLKHTGIKNNMIYSGYDFLRASIVNGCVPMAAWLYVYKRDFLLNNKLFFKKGILHEDEEFTPRAILSARSIVNTGIEYYHYLIRENSIMTTPDKRKNIDDFYETCEFLCNYYNQINDDEFRNLLKDILVNKFLSIYQSGKMYQHGNAYLHKSFVVENSYRSRTKRKAALYSFSPRLYWHLNNFLKRKV